MIGTTMGKLAVPAFLAALLVACGLAAGAGGGRVAGPTWVVDGEVRALAVAGGKVFVAGDFKRVSVPTGPVVAFTAAGRRAFPAVDVDAEVQAVIGDDRGGWFVAGDFTRIGGVACPMLAHVLRSRAVDRGFCPRPDGPVRALALSGSRLYVGGEFDRIAGVARHSVAAFDLRRNRLTSFRPSGAPYSVWQLAVAPHALYVLGAAAFLALDPESGRRLAFAPDADVDVHGDSVDGFAIAGGRVYAWGVFNRIGGRSRGGLAALDARSGKALDWAPRGVYPTAGIVANGVLYLSGGFRSVEGRPRGGLAAFDAATGTLLPWRAAALPTWANALAVAGDVLYTVGPATRRDAVPSNVGARSVRSGSAVRVPALQVNGYGGTLAAQGATVVLGGRFRSIGGAVHPYLLAFDPASGQPLTWDPRISGAAVWELAVLDSTLYTAGFVSRVGGQARSDFAAFDTATGRLLDWRPGRRYVEGLAANHDGLYTATNPVGAETLFRLDPHTGATIASSALGGRVDMLAASDEAVYVGAVIAKRFGVAALDPRSLRIEASVGVQGQPGLQAIAADGSHVYAAGEFTSIGGVEQRYLARLTLDGTELRVDPWRPRTPGPVRLVTVAGDEAYVAGNVGDGQQIYVAAVNVETGALRFLAPRAAGTGQLHTIAVARDAVYVGGDFGLRRFRR